MPSVKESVDGLLLHLSGPHAIVLPFADFAQLSTCTFKFGCLSIKTKYLSLKTFWYILCDLFQYVKYLLGWSALMFCHNTPWGYGCLNIIFNYVVLCCKVNEICCECANIWIITLFWSI